MSSPDIKPARGPPAKTLTRQGSGRARTTPKLDDARDSKEKKKRPQKAATSRHAQKPNVPGRSEPPSTAPSPLPHSRAAILARVPRQYTLYWLDARGVKQTRVFEAGRQAANEYRQLADFARVLCRGNYIQNKDAGNPGYG